MMILETAIVVICSGLTLSFAAFIFFRKPGVPLWFYGPVWRASEYVTATGSLLWKIGTFVGLTGATLLLWQIFGAMP
jgi:hypothetical protein